MRCFSFLLTLLFLSSAARPQNPLTGHLVYQTPGMQLVKVKEDNTYKNIHDTALKFDIYYPQNNNAANLLPLVIFNNGVGGMELPKWGIYKDWGRLIAASGMIAINYQARQGHTLEDGEALIDFVINNSTRLGVDTNKIGLWTCSANTPTGTRLAFKTRAQNIKVLIIYYGVMDSLGELRQDLPVLLVRAGLDGQFINIGIEDFVQSALQQDVRLQFINYLHGMHAFDAFTNTEESKAIILQTVAFLKKNLSSPVTDTQFTITNRNYMYLAMHGQIHKAVNEFRKARIKYGADSSYSRFYNAVLREDVLNTNAYWLLRHDKLDEALETFKLVVETYPQSPNAYDALADYYDAAGNKEDALKNAQAALQKLETVTGIDTDVKERIRTSAMQKINRLKQ